jgi:DNA-binding transcriptional LysR family regulator
MLMSYTPFKDQLKQFLILCEHRNISRAAKHLGLSQPQLTKDLQSLEEDLGFPLFERTNRGLVETELGNQFFQHVQKLEQSWSEIMGDRQELAGLLRIGAHPLIAKLRLPEIVEAVTINFPKVAVQYFETSSKDASHLVSSGKLDIAIAANPDSLSGLQLTEVAKEEIAIWSAGKVSDILVVNPQVVQFARLVRSARYRRVIEIQNYDVACAIALKLKCHALLPEPALSDSQAAFTRVKTLNVISIKMVTAIRSRKNPVIRMLREKLKPR